MPLLTNCPPYMMPPDLKGNITDSENFNAYEQAYLDLIVVRSIGFIIFASNFYIATHHKQFSIQEN